MKINPKIPDFAKRRNHRNKQQLANSDNFKYLKKNGEPQRREFANTKAQSWEI